MILQETILNFDFDGAVTCFYNYSKNVLGIENGLKGGYLSISDLSTIGLSPDTIRLVIAVNALSYTNLDSNYRSNWNDVQTNAFTIFCKDVFFRVKKECICKLVTGMDFSDGEDYGYNSLTD